MAVKGSERTTAQNMRALFSGAKFLQWLRKNMGLGDTLGPLPAENGGTGRAGTGQLVQLTESASGSVMTYTCPDSLDGHELVVLAPFFLDDNNGYGSLNFVQGVTVPIAAFTTYGQNVVFLGTRNSETGAQMFIFTARRRSGTTITLDAGAGKVVSKSNNSLNFSYAI